MRETAPSVGGRRYRPRCRAAPRDGARLAAAHSPSPAGVTSSQSVAADRWERLERFLPHRVSQRSRPCVSAYARASHGSSSRSCRVASDPRKKIDAAEDEGIRRTLIFPADCETVKGRAGRRRRAVDGSRVPRNCHGQRNTGWVVFTPNQRDIFSEYLEKCWTMKNFPGKFRGYSLNRIVLFILVRGIYCDARLFSCFRVALTLCSRRRWCVHACVRARARAKLDVLTTRGDWHLMRRWPCRE